MKKIFSFAMGVGWVFSLPFAGSTEAQEIGTWAGFREGTAVFTFDDGCANQLSIAVPIFDKYGYKASFYIVNNWGPNYSAYQTLVNQGYEVGSHSDSHANNMPDSEIASSKATINSKITGQTCNTITYPNCNKPTESILQQHYIGGRICNNQIDGSTPYNYYQIGSIICGNTGSVNSSSAFQQKMQEAINKKGWVTFLIHEVDNGSGYSPTASSAIDGALNWAKQNDSKIWITTFRNAIMYSKERDGSKLTKISGDIHRETYTLTHSLDQSISNYDYPLSIRVQNKNNWTTIKATQKGKNLEAFIRDGYIYFDAIPNGGEITLSDGVQTALESSSSGYFSSSSEISTINFSSSSYASIFPNSSESSLGLRQDVSFFSQDKLISCNIFDMKGQKIKSAQIMSATAKDFWKIYQKDLQAGIYLLQLSNGINTKILKVQKK